MRTGGRREHTNKKIKVPGDIAGEAPGGRARK